jgi:hypothetical protein
MAMPLKAVPLIGVHIIYHTGVELKRMDIEKLVTNKYSKVTNQR